MSEEKKLTIVVTEDTFDKAMMSMFMATTAAGMGVGVHVYFSFFGLNLLRKGFQPELPEKYKPMTGHFMEKMKGMGINSMDDMMATATELGVKFYACSTSMGMMDVAVDDLVDGVTVLGAAGFIDVAIDSDAQLFIG